ncbi:MAG: pyridoxal-phosphate dependent enzyme [Bacteroidota bacterium]|jgi:threonine synthase|nr:pyridoxal-phosphate dependent enzyme [Bacteroidota bacterium]NLP20028.1 pyridoxal-phosphate dependent enzyme [Bacteroidales bacterium]OQC45085.1 MAG: Threonine synthase [Bacteroidetes bacterium ADurb.Bin028]HNY44326.1 pyridoxal-phosphate dependent enzyme [Bacteroidales bacterium]HOD88899.1 pyridoxal-phosphate dependent enzyme [Bacteroidales bacterium]
MKESKYYLQCVKCEHITEDFGAWFEQNQVCPKCGSKHSEVWYNSDYNELPLIMKGNPESFWQYFYYLPLNRRENIITRNEGAISLQKWWFLEDFAKEKYGLNLDIYVYRNDLNGGTGTFKDVAAALAASVLKEYDINQYCVASTGNTATSYARYLSIAGINCSIFLPENALKSSEAMISAFGQNVYRVKGDYSKAKEIAAEYAKKYNILISSGNIDPLRVEAKKTMVFEWLRQIGKMPDVYIQAISGGTGPIALDKGVREIKKTFPEIKNPRMIMVQPDACDPMTQAWEKAEAKNFPKNYENDYPILDNPQTQVPTLATGNPATYPIVSRIIKKSGGTFIRMKEEKLVPIGRLVAYERKLLLGPASAVCLGGFFEALEKNLLKSDETIIINIGEGVRRAPEFVEQMIYTSKDISSVDECKPHQIDDYRQQLWNDVLK